MRFDCAQTEIAFLQKRLAQLEERLGAEHSARTGLEQKASAAWPAPALRGNLGHSGSCLGAGLLLGWVSGG